LIAVVNVDGFSFAPFVAVEIVGDNTEITIKIIKLIYI
jgi:hypothetical protein